MNTGDQEALRVFVAGIAGMLFQRFVRAPAQLPMWLFQAGVGLAAIGLYMWSTPDVVEQFRTNWRLGLMGLVGWFLMVRGGSASAKDSKIAPPANSR